jgi:hypothetical protein
LCWIGTDIAMRLGEVNPSAFRRHEAAGHRTEPQGDVPASESRALVTIAPATGTSAGQPAHSDVAFLAQLIATKDQHPQTRERRRAEPTEVLAAYRAAAALNQA